MMLTAISCFTLFCLITISSSTGRCPDTQIPDATPTQCFDCNSLDGGETCTSCYFTCATCKGSVNNCITCKPNHILSWYPDLQSYLCDECPTGYESKGGNQTSCTLPQQNSDLEEANKLKIANDALEATNNALNLANHALEATNLALQTDKKDLLTKLQTKDTETQTLKASNENLTNQNIALQKLNNVLADKNNALEKANQELEQKIFTLNKEPSMICNTCDYYINAKGWTADFTNISDLSPVPIEITNVKTIAEPTNLHITMDPGSSPEQSREEKFYGILGMIPAYKIGRWIAYAIKNDSVQMQKTATIDITHINPWRLIHTIYNGIDAFNKDSNFGVYVGRRSLGAGKSPIIWANMPGYALEHWAIKINGIGYHLYSKDEDHFALYEIFNKPQIMDSFDWFFINDNECLKSLEDMQQFINNLAVKYSLIPRKERLNCQTFVILMYGWAFDKEQDVAEVDIIAKLGNSWY